MRRPRGSIGRYSANRSRHSRKVILIVNQGTPPLDSTATKFLNFNKKLDIVRFLVGVLGVLLLYFLVVTHVNLATIHGSLVASEFWLMLQDDMVLLEDVEVGNFNATSLDHLFLPHENPPNGLKLEGTRGGQSFGIDGGTAILNHLRITRGSVLFFRNHDNNCRLLSIVHGYVDGAVSIPSNKDMKVWYYNGGASAKNELEIQPGNMIMFSSDVTTGGKFVDIAWNSPLSMTLELGGVDSIGFNNFVMPSGASETSPSILGGDIHVSESKKEFDVWKSDSICLEFAYNPSFRILCSSTAYELEFFGIANCLKVYRLGNEINLIPSWLEFIDNNSLIALLYAGLAFIFMVMITIQKLKRK